MKGIKMISVDIPGYGHLRLQHAVFDYNGTLATDGHIEKGTRELLDKLSALLEIHIITADTFGLVKKEITGFKGNIIVLKQGQEREQKKHFINDLEGETVAFGNGRNDRYMLEEARLGIIIIGNEGAAVETVQKADIMVHAIHDGLNLLLHPLRLKATLRA